MRTYIPYNCLLKEEDVIKIDINFSQSSSTSNSSGLSTVTAFAEEVPIFSTTEWNFPKYQKLFGWNSKFRKLMPTEANNRLAWWVRSARNRSSCCQFLWNSRNEIWSRKQWNKKSKTRRCEVDIIANAPVSIFIVTFFHQICKRTSLKSWWRCARKDLNKNLTSDFESDVGLDVRCVVGGDDECDVSWDLGKDLR